MRGRNKRELWQDNQPGTLGITFIESPVVNIKSVHNRVEGEHAGSIVFVININQNGAFACFILSFGLDVGSAVGQVMTGVGYPVAVFEFVKSEMQVIEVFGTGCPWISGISVIEADISITVNKVKGKTSAQDFVPQQIGGFCFGEVLKRNGGNFGIGNGLFASGNQQKNSYNGQ